MCRFAIMTSLCALLLGSLLSVAKADQDLHRGRS